MPSRIAVAVIAVVAAAAVPLASQDRGRALTIEDYYRVRTVGNPSFSPDAAWVAFTVSTRVEDDKDPNRTRIESFVVASDASGAPRRIEHEGKDVTNPRWGDEGWLHYNVERQVWKIDPNAPGSAPQRVEGSGAAPAAGRGGRGAAPAAARSADGKWIVRSEAKPQTRSEPSYASEFEKRHLTDRFKGVIFDWKDFQRDGAPFPAPDPTAMPALRLTLEPSEGGGARSLVDEDLRPANVAWHPNGELIAFTADPDWRDPLKYASPDVWTVTKDGTLRRLTDDGYVYADTEFSPDGKYLSYARTFGTDMVIAQKLNHGGPRDLFIRPLIGGAPINLTAKWDLEPGNANWSPDSRFIYFTAATGGESHLFRVSVPGGVVEQVTKGPRRLTALSIDRSFRRIVYTLGLHDSPGDLYVADIDGTNERRLTDVHGDLTREIAFSKAERLRWPSYDGTPIEGWLMFPYGYDAKKGPYPMIVVSHGGPHSATGYSFNFKHQYFAANGYFVLDTNFRSSTGYGEAFKWATWGAWGDKDGQDVMSGVDYVLKRHPVDPKRVGHTGHSYGGFMTNWLITQYPDRFAAAISGAGISNWISDYGTADIYRTKETEFFGTPWEKEARDRMIRQSPLTYAGRVKTPTLFVHGEVDQRVPYEEAEQMYFALKRRGVPAKMIQYKDQPHGIGGHWNNVHRMLSELAWWEKYLKGGQLQTSNSKLPD